MKDKQLLALIKEIEAWLCFNTHPSMEQINDFRLSLKSTIAQIESELAKEEPEKIPVFDSSDISEDDKKNTIDQFIRLTAKHTLQLFMMLGLKTHIEAMVVNEPTKEEFIFSFKKVPIEEPEGVTAEEILSEVLGYETPIEENDLSDDITVSEALEAMESYAKTKQIDLSITDSDIEAWAEPFKYKSNHIWDERSLIEGAKAMKDGEIKHLNNL